MALFGTAALAIWMYYDYSSAMKAKKKAFTTNVNTFNQNTPFLLIARVEVKPGKVQEYLKLAKEDLAVIARFTDKNIPVVVVLLSGRPMIVTDEIDRWDSFVAAWLPGTEGSGVADVLFGDYNPTGKLSFSWPKNMDQFPINPEDDHLYNFGYGLSY